MSTIPTEVPPYGGCLWPVDPACFSEEWNDLDEAVKERSLALASSTLRRLTAYRVGGCPITVRPCKRSCAVDNGWARWGSDGLTFHPQLTIDGRWVNSCGCRTECACSALCEIALPLPIGEVIEVNVSGVDLTADTKVQGDRLVYTGTEDCPFPTCQDLAAPVGAPNTFAVTYRNSYPVDSLGAYAAGVLAMEYAKACTGGKNCRLPKGTTQVVRQGLTIEIDSATFPDGLTGIREVDTYIALWRPEGSPSSPARFWSPGMGVTRVER